MKLGERRECRAPRFFTPSRVSLTPPIHHRLPCDYAIAIAQVISTAPGAAVAPATAVTELPCLHHARNVLCTGVLWMHL